MTPTKPANPVLARLQRAPHRVQHSDGHGPFRYVPDVATVRGDRRPPATRSLAIRLREDAMGWSVAGPWRTWPGGRGGSGMSGSDTCPVCGVYYSSAAPSRMSVGHILPRCRGGGDEPGNLRLMCSMCNNLLEACGHCPGALGAVLSCSSGSRAVVFSVARRWFRERFARHHSAVPDVSPLWGPRWGA